MTSTEKLPPTLDRGVACLAVLMVAGLATGASALETPASTTTAIPATAAAEIATSSVVLARSKDGGALGTVALPALCTAEAQTLLERGLALLHHMNYVEAESDFHAAELADPECALPPWGIATTWVHPLWPDTISAEKREAGMAMLERAALFAEGSPRELAWIAASRAYYEGAERGERERLASLLEGWQSVHRAYPDDPEAAAFYALALLANAPAQDKSYARQIEAGLLLEGLRERFPEHPGAHHYTIHAYDVPALAERALATARRYDDLAPENTHALHMTSHIFTRLGLWPESIEFNLRAAEAAAGRTPAGEVSLHLLHALDYLAYAYLQQGDDRAAGEVQARIEALEPPFQNHAATAYAFAAVPVRLALERQDWRAAATIELPWREEIPWREYPYLEAFPYFARALGAARVGQLEAARAAITQLERLEAAARSLDVAYDWGTQVLVQRRIAEAWLAHAEGSTERALALAHEAAELEAATEKNPITPGEVLPAQELYGDLLAAVGQPGAAIEAYEAALARSPNRLNSLAGAARAAEATGRKELAAEYFGRLLEIAAESTDRPAVEEARTNPWGATRPASTG